MNKGVIGFLTIGAAAVGYGISSTITVYVDGKEVGQGMVINGTTYVPVRTVAEALGAEVKNEPILQAVNIIPKPPAPAPDPFPYAAVKDVPLTLWPLVGLQRKVHVIVELQLGEGSPSIEKSNIKDSLELALQTNGFSVTDKPDGLLLSYTAVSVHDDKMPISSLSLAMDCDDTVTQTAHITCCATLWHSGGVATYGDRVIADLVKKDALQRLDSFMNAYMKANPKKGE